MQTSTCNACLVVTPVNCMNRGERRLISIWCQKESVDSNLDGHMDSHSDYSIHLLVVQNFDTKSLNIDIIGNFNTIYFNLT